MQGVKIYQEKLFSSFQLSDHIPANNFYRGLKEVLLLDFLCEQTKPYYGVSDQQSIEPVFGTLTQFMGLRKIHTIGIQQANKVMHLSAIAYNLKKYLKFERRRIKSEARSLLLFFLDKMTTYKVKRFEKSHSKYTFYILN